MRIVAQSVSISYSPFLALPAPRIAGLLPAPKPPPLPTFSYANSRLAELNSSQQRALFSAATLLFDIAVRHQSGEMSDHALNTALAAFRRAMTGQPARPMNPAAFAAEMDVPLLQFLMESGLA